MTSDIHTIILHCSDSPSGRGDTASTIHRWHQDRGWSGIGYHYVIEDSGDIAPGRPPYWKGAHCKGFNKRTLGVCIIGKNYADFTPDQRAAAIDLLELLCAQHQLTVEDIKGHYELDPRKTCPGWDMDSVRAQVQALMGEAQ